jgi:hypothetical protein
MEYFKAIKWQFFWYLDAMLNAGCNALNRLTDLCVVSDTPQRRLLQYASSPLSRTMVGTT